MASVSVVTSVNHLYSSEQHTLQSVNQKCNQLNWWHQWLRITDTDYCKWQTKYNSKVLQNKCS